MFTKRKQSIAVVSAIVGALIFASVATVASAEELDPTTVTTETVAEPIVEEVPEADPAPAEEVTEPAEAVVEDVVEPASEEEPAAEPEPIVEETPEVVAAPAEETEVVAEIPQDNLSPVTTQLVAEEVNANGSFVGFGCVEREGNSVTDVYGVLFVPTPSTAVYTIVDTTSGVDYGPFTATEGNPFVPLTSFTEDSGTFVFELYLNGELVGFVDVTTDCLANPATGSLTATVDEDGATVTVQATNPLFNDGSGQLPILIGLTVDGDDSRFTPRSLAGGESLNTTIELPCQNEPYGLELTGDGESIATLVVEAPCKKDPIDPIDPSDPPTDPSDPPVTPEEPPVVTTPPAVVTGDGGGGDALDNTAYESDEDSLASTGSNAGNLAPLALVALVLGGALVISRVVMVKRRRGRVESARS